MLEECLCTKQSVTVIERLLLNMTENLHKLLS